jgi:hypothetical protein
LEVRYQPQLELAELDRLVVLHLVRKLEQRVVQVVQ